MTEPITPVLLREYAVRLTNQPEVAGGAEALRGSIVDALGKAAAEIERLQRELRVSGRALELVDGWVGDEYITLVRNAEQQARAEIEKEAETND